MFVCLFVFNQRFSSRDQRGLEGAPKARELPEVKDVASLEGAPQGGIGSVCPRPKYFLAPLQFAPQIITNVLRIYQI